MVAAALLNYSRPTLGEALDRLVQRGATAVTVLPYFLVAGHFTRVVLPQALAALQTAHPGLTLMQAAPLGVHPALAALVRQRAVAGGAKRESAVLLAAHGSRDPQDNAPILAVAALLRAAGAFGAVSVGYLGLNEPSLPAAIAAAVTAGARHLVVVPYLLQLGKHTAEDVTAAVATARRGYPSVQIQLAAQLGYDPLLVEVLATHRSRISE